MYFQSIKRKLSAKISKLVQVWFASVFAPSSIFGCLVAPWTRPMQSVPNSWCITGLLSRLNLVIFYHIYLFLNLAIRYYVICPCMCLFAVMSPFARYCFYNFGNVLKISGLRSDQFSWEVVSKCGGHWFCCTNCTKFFP